MPLILFLLACHGLTNIVTGSRLFAPIRTSLARVSRRAGEWIACTMCFGFAAGVLFAALGLCPFEGTAPVRAFAAGVTSSGFCWFMHVLLVRLGENEL